MAGIELLAPELLLEIMFMLPDNIGQKFTVTQVLRLWRDVALDSHLFWSSLRGDSEADYRVYEGTLGNSQIMILASNYKLKAYHHDVELDSLEFGFFAFELYAHSTHLFDGCKLQKRPRRARAWVPPRACASAPSASSSSSSTERLRRALVDFR
ncbi:hypothetical protein B0H14DRAFT_3855084 [Mycena olivaceomarginata]|nr:hypothetical protein B0H14DRAFT_3855084 [Mycena olivaceomarginata]